MSSMRTGGQTTVYGSSEGGTCARGGREVLRLAVALAMTLALVWCGGGMRGYACADEVAGGTSEGEAEAQASAVEDANGTELSDPDNAETLQTVEETVYSQLINELDGSDLFVNDVQARYVSQEYLDEIAYNSQANIYFGYTLAEVEEAFGDTRYVFTLDDDGETTVVPFEDYDDTFDQVVHNLAVGGGVILLCTTISVISAPLSPAVCVVFAVAADQALKIGVTGGLIAGALGGVITGVQTGDAEAALKSAALAGSDGFRWGAIGGAVIGGYTELSFLSLATRMGLTADEAALIQVDSGYSLTIINHMRNPEEYYQVYKTAGLTEDTVNGSKALVRDIDLTYRNPVNGKTNLELMQNGNAPFDPETGLRYELHHIGQKADSPLAILTESEHNSSVLHATGQASEIDRVSFNKTRKAFWESMAKKLG